MPPTATHFALGAIGQIALTVHDLDRSVAFYRDALALRFLFRVPGLAFFDCEGIRLMLSLPEESAAGGTSSVLYFRVPDIQGAHAALAARGVSFEGPPHRIAVLDDHELWMAFFRDPDAHLLALMAEVPRTAG
jgi:methylmalonyl-CoA/ethylmalonyl-CoA epimerase